MNLSLNEMIMVKAAMDNYNPRRQVLKDQKEAMMKKLNEQIRKQIEEFVI